jgi:predicted Fe-Mo cluster-binding NifX family protein
MKSEQKVVVPTNNPGGMEAERSDHFGHCDVFTMVTVNNGQISKVETMEQVEHGAGGCMVPVQTLKDYGAHAIVVGGIGARPLAGFSEVGVDVYFAPREQIRTVEEVMNAFLAGNLPIMQPTQACKGSGNCHH